MRPTPADTPSATSRLPDNVAVFRSTSEAVTGVLHLRAEDLDVAQKLGPEVFGVAPLPYEQSVVLAYSRLIHGGQIGDVRVSACSDVAARASSGFASAEVRLVDLDMRITRHLRLRVAELASRSLVTWGAGQLCRDVEFMVRDGTLELDGEDPIDLPARAEPNTAIRADLLEPLGVRLVLNELGRCAGGRFQPFVRGTAFRLVFEKAAVGSDTLWGELEVAVTGAGLELGLSASDRSEAPRLSHGSSGDSGAMSVSPPLRAVVPAGAA